MWLNLTWIKLYNITSSVSVFWITSDKVVEHISLNPMKSSSSNCICILLTETPLVPKSQMVLVYRLLRFIE